MATGWGKEATELVGSEDMEILATIRRKCGVAAWSSAQEKKGHANTYGDIYLLNLDIN